MNGPIIQPAGNVPAFANLVVLFWSLVNVLIPLAIVALLIWYLKKQNDHRKEMNNKMDSILELLQAKRNLED